MATLKAPSVTIAFHERAASRIARGTRGVVALILKDTTAQTAVVYDVTDIPAGLTDLNAQLIKDALVGYQTTPSKVIVYVLADGEEVDYAPAMDYFDTEDFDYMAAPYATEDGAAADLVTWIKSIRENDYRKAKLVINNAAATEGVINWDSTLYRTGSDDPVTAAYGSARIAGLLAGTAMTASATYAPLTDFADCARLTKEQRDAAVGAGKLVAFWDGEKVKICRAVNSFVTTTGDKGDSFKKIRLVEIMDLIRTDINSTIQDSYIGKYINSYDNKCLLVTAINAYFQSLVDEGALLGGSCEINVTAQRNYIAGKGVDVSKLTDQEIKEYNTDSHVFLAATLSMADVFEDVVLDISI